MLAGKYAGRAMRGHPARSHQEEQRAIHRVLIRFDAGRWRDNHDLIIDHGEIRKRKKAASRKFRGAYGHTPLSIEEDIPWQCRRLVIGTGADGALPAMKQVEKEARHRKVNLVLPPTTPGLLTWRLGYGVSRGC